MQTTKQRSDQVGGGVFLIGLALLFLTGYWWPGIMFVISASLVAGAWVETGGKLELSHSKVVAAGIVALIGLVGVLDINWGQLWPIVLIVIGVSMLFGRNLFPRKEGHSNGSGDYVEVEKPKNKSVTIDEDR